MAEYVPRRALIHPEDAAPEPRGRRFLEEDAVGDRFYDDEAPAPRRSAPEPEELEPSPSRQEAAALLSTLAAPIVIAASIGLGLAASYAVPNPETSVPAPRPSVTSTEPGPTPALPTQAPTVEPGEELALNDASFTLPADWHIDADEQVEDGRRALRVSHPATDTRLQAVTLPASEDDLQQACSALVDLQQQAYEGVSRSLASPLSVRGDGSGLTCGFTGSRTEDGVPNTVTFQMVTRDEDGHLLLLRSTVPTDVGVDSPARGQLVSMQCEASASFGVRLPLC